MRYHWGRGLFCFNFFAKCIFTVSVLTEPIARLLSAPECQRGQLGLVEMHLAKKLKQNRPLPQWYRMKTGTKIRYGAMAGDEKGFAQTQIQTAPTSWHPPLPLLISSHGLREDLDRQDALGQEVEAEPTPASVVPHEDWHQDPLQQVPTTLAKGKDRPLSAFLSFPG
eukprot:CAMPEP_0194783460 /NCGR_PEP_ID=MMETSP0323_2-20130528/79232_1 /TAXON_ID=2866 ORGANISM="Crypthecodinium cohnii, Strain Seligo" /NCGR_SAMPLE_ID=MMETSP0323_2 /ASSEMBLY_ACC=CAM_ASM_000346 /LENGTH=166 /DNA_ID=CAMNT_0039722349 /DNA_START=239 /DNA_END=740 /DNA_ORIENTATION=+